MLLVIQLLTMLPPGKDRFRFSDFKLPNKVNIISYTNKTTSFVVSVEAVSKVGTREDSANIERFGSELNMSWIRSSVSFAIRPFTYPWDRKA